MSSEYSMDIWNNEPEHGVWHWALHKPVPGQKQILVSSLAPLLPPVAGGPQYVCNALLPLSGEYSFHLLVVGYAPMLEEIRPHLAEYGKHFCTVTLVENDPRPATPEGLKAYYAERLELGLPFLDISYYSKRVLDAVTRLDADYGIDMLEPHSTHVAYLKKFFPHIPALLASHNIESELFPFWIQPNTGLSPEELDAVATQSRQNARQAEIENAWNFEAMTFISPEDMAKVSAPVPKFHLPLSFPLCGKPYEQKSDSVCRILWMGGFDWGPNEEGMRWFAKEIFPLIKTELAGKRIILDIVGANPRPEVQALHDGEHVFVHNFVDDLTPILDGAHLLMVPLLRGGGVRVKVLQAMSHGIPVLGTSKGCEGIGLVHKRDVWLADTAEEFAASILEMAVAPELRKRLSDNGLGFLYKNHNPGHAVSLKRNIYQKLLYAKAASPNVSRPAATPQPVSDSPYNGLTAYKNIKCRESTKYTQLPESARFSLAIPVKNEAKTLPELLEGIAAQSARPTELLLVDHDSTDDTVAIARTKCAELNLPLTLLHAADSPQRKKGHPSTLAGNKNYALQMAKEEIVLFTDAGTKPTPTFLANLAGALLDNPTVDIVGGVYDIHIKKPGILLHPYDNINYHYYLPPGAALGLRKRIREKTGGFPEFLSYAGEDTLLDFTARRHYEEWLIAPHARTVWNKSGTIEEEWKRNFNYGMGDGESGLGDFHWYGASQTLLDTQGLSPQMTPYQGYTLMPQAFQGYLAGRMRRGEIDRTRRGIAQTTLLVVQKNLFHAPSSAALVKRLIDEEHSRVVCVIADQEPVSHGTPPLFLDFDISLFELWFLKDFSLEHFLACYGHADLFSSLRIMTDQKNQSDVTKQFIAKISGIFRPLQ